MTIKSIIKGYRDKGYFKHLLYVMVVFIAIFFLVRNSIVQVIFENKCSSIENRLGLAINAKKVGFSSLTKFYIDRLIVIPKNRDTLISVDKIEVSLGLKDLFFLKVNPLEVWLTNPKISLVGEKDSSNYSFLLGVRKDSLHQSFSMVNSNERQSVHHNAIYRMLKGVFGFTTAKYHVSNFLFSYVDSSYSTLITVPEFESNEKGFDTKVEVHEKDSTSYININGQADKRSASITLNVSMVGGKKPLPLLYHKFGINLSFDTLGLRITAKQFSGDDIQLGLNSSVSSLEVQSQRLSDQTVEVKRGSLSFDISVNSNYYLIDSTSTIDLNGLKARLYLKYTPELDRYLAFKIATDEFPSQLLFDALPDGLFSNLKGIKTHGTISYCFDFGVKLDKPDSIYLNPKLITKNFSITQYGYRNFNALNDTFSHDVYDEGVFVKSIHLGSGSKGFKSLDQISPLIIDAVVTSEDGGFFSNNGFDIDAFKYAISENIKQKRFARGGSTITMQLVKNLYLNKNKNLFRKAEEYLIVWLVESQGIVSKERLLEIYLNIIEWGSGIYGVNEACQYYFNKDTKDVTLDEAIFLASIIPRPKKVTYLFEKDGNLKSFMEGDFDFVATKMLQRGMITEENYSSLKYNVNLAGRAKELFMDSTLFPIDSLSIDEITFSRDSSLLSP